MILGPLDGSKRVYLLSAGPLRLSLGRCPPNSPCSCPWIRSSPHHGVRRSHFADPNFRFADRQNLIREVIEGITSVAGNDDQDGMVLALAGVPNRHAQRGGGISHPDQAVALGERKILAVSGGNVRLPALPALSSISDGSVHRCGHTAHVNHELIGVRNGSRTGRLTVVA